MLLRVGSRLPRSSMSPRVRNLQLGDGEKYPSKRRPEEDGKPTFPVLDSLIPQTIYRCICFRNHNQFPLLEQDRSIEKDCREERTLSLLTSKEDGAPVIHQAFRPDQPQGDRAEGQRCNRKPPHRRVGPRLPNRRILIASWRRRRRC